MFLLVISEILGLFLNTLTADNMSLLGNSENLHQPIQMPLSNKQKTFYQFLSPFLKCGSILNILKKKMTLIAYAFSNWWTAKGVVKHKPKKSRFRTPFNSLHAQGSQTQLKSARNHLYHIFSSPWGKWKWKMYLLGLFLNTLTGDDKYPLRNSENLQQTIQMLLPKKQKPFSEFFAAFLKSTSNSEHVGKKDNSYNLSLLEITDCKRRS